MADIDVVPKQKSNVWLWWIIAALVIAVILFLVFGGSSDTASALSDPLAAPAVTSTAVGRA